MYNIVVLEKIIILNDCISWKTMYKDKQSFNENRTDNYAEQDTKSCFIRSETSTVVNYYLYNLAYRSAVSEPVTHLSCFLLSDNHDDSNKYLATEQTTTNISADPSTQSLSTPRKLPYPNPHSAENCTIHSSCTLF